MTEAKASPAIRAEDLAEMVEYQEREAEARRRTIGLHDAEQRKRRQLAHELVAALREPLIPGSPPSDLERIAALQTGARPARVSASRPTAKR